MKKFVKDKVNGLVVKSIYEGPGMTLVETIDHVRYQRLNSQIDWVDEKAEGVSEMVEANDLALKYICGVFKDKQDD